MARCYGTLEYWNERYQYKEEQYEWYAPYSSIRHLMTPALLSPPDGVHTHKPRRTIEVRDRFGNLVPRSIVDLNRRPMTSGKPFPPRSQCRVLIVGCGNSRFGEEMMMDGWTGGIVNVDFSPTVIEQMNRRYNSEFYDSLNASRRSHLSITPHPMVFECVDVTKGIPHPDESFDVLVIKATLDAILCSAGSVANAKRLMQECCRVLRSEHGAMVAVTNGSPDNRLVFFENQGDEWWEGLGVHTIPRPFNKVQLTDAGKDYYVYVSRKRPGAGKVSALQVSVDVKNQTHAKKTNEENNHLPPQQRIAPMTKPSETVHKNTSAAAPTASRASFTTLLR